MSKLRIKPCLDSIELSERRRKELAIQPELAESLGRSAVEGIELGFYLMDRGKVDWSEWVQAACKAKVSIQLDAALPHSNG